MNDENEQEEYYVKALKNIFEAKSNFDKLTLGNQEKFAKEVLESTGMSDIIMEMRKYIK